MIAQRLDITGMSCGRCVAHVREALESLDAVTVDEVRVGAAEVRYDGSRRNVDELVEAVREAGYDAVAAPTSAGGNG
ncbi:MAG TPA: cation transporter [Gemmatimonadales bacterium]